VPGRDAVASGWKARAQLDSPAVLDEYEIALFLHVLGALLFAAGIFVAGVAFEAARRRELPAEVALLLGLTRVGVLLVVVGTLLLLGCGIWLVDLLGLSYGAGWLTWALALFGLSVILGGIGGQRPKQARRLAARLAQEGEAASAELRALLDDRLSLAANYLSAALVVAILALMVFKP
jgi:uncharacterized membrane protein